MTKEERIKKLRNQFKYTERKLIEGEGEGGKARYIRSEKNKATQKALEAAEKKLDKVRKRKREQGSKYEAQSAAGTAKSAADRERHMKLVLGDDWKPSDEGRLNRDRVLAKMDKRNRALDPENDPGLLSGLRNKLGIMPTAAENERRVMAKNAARREQARLSEGEAAGAGIGSVAETIRQRRKARYQQLAASEGGALEELGTGVYQKDRDSREKRKAEYKGFLDEAALRGQEGARRGDHRVVGSTSGSLDEVGGGALAHLKDKERPALAEMRKQDFLTEAEQQKYGVERKSQLPPSIRARLDDPERGGRGSWRGMKEELGGKSMPFTEAMKKEQGGESIPFTEEMAEEQGGRRISPYRPDIMRDGKMDWRGKEKELGGESIDLSDPKYGGESLDLNEKENRELLRGVAPEKAASLDQGDIDKQMTEGMAQDEVERAVNEEFTGTMNQEEAQQAIRDASPKDQKAISAEIAETKGMGSDEWVESKEATGEYVRYEGSGLVINMAALGKDIQRNRNMEMLKHIPAANRAAMLVEWGYIDPGDLSIAQKQSAKELKELTLLDLKIAETQGKIAKDKNKLGEKEKIRYTAATKSMQQALKDKDYGLAEVYRNELNSISPTGDTSNFKDLIEKGIKKANLRTPDKVFKAAGLPDGKEYYKSKRSIVEKVNFLRESKGTARTSQLNQLLGTTMSGEGGGEGVTYGKFLTSQGIPPWKDVKGQKKVGNVPDWALTNEESYMSWALPQIEDKLMIGIWGNIHTQVNDFNMKGYRKKQEELSQNVMNYQTGERWSESTDYEASTTTTPTTSTATTTSEPAVEPTALTGTPEEMQAAIDAKSQGIRDAEIAKSEEAMVEEQLKTSIQNAGEMQYNFEELSQEIAGYDKHELREGLRLQKDKLAKAEWDKRGEPELNMIRQLIKYLDHKLKTKK